MTVLNKTTQRLFLMGETFAETTQIKFSVFMEWWRGMRNTKERRHWQKMNLIQLQDQFTMCLVRVQFTY